MILSALLLALLGTTTPFQDDGQPLALASGGELLPEQACFDVQHVTLELRVDPTERSIAGTMSMNARCVEATTRIFLDLDFPLEVTRVQLRGDEAKFVRKDGRIEIPAKPPLVAGQDFGVVVEYAGKPRTAKRAPWDGGFTWAETADGSPWFTTTCQGEGADLWWPCKDHPSDKPSRRWISASSPCPRDSYCASNGTLVVVDETPTTAAQT